MSETTEHLIAMHADRCLRVRACGHDTNHAGQVELLYLTDGEEMPGSAYLNHNDVRELMIALDQAEAEAARYREPAGGEDFDARR